MRGVSLRNQHPLRLNVGFMLHQSVGFSRDFTFDLPALVVGDDLEVSSLQGTVTISRTGQGFLTRGLLTALSPQVCGRCLTEYSHMLTAKFSELYTQPPHEPEDPTLVISESGILDLNPVVREYMLLEVPMRPLCRPDCAGICAECGANRNLTQCDHPEADIDPRFEALRSLLPKP